MESEAGAPGAMPVGIGTTGQEDKTNGESSGKSSGNGGSSAESGKSSESRISIRIPRKVVSGEDSKAISGEDSRAVSGEDSKAASGEDSKAASGEDSKAASGEDSKAASGEDSKAASGEDSKAASGEDSKAASGEDSGVASAPTSHSPNQSDKETKENSKKAKPLMRGRKRKGDDSEDSAYSQSSGSEDGESTDAYSEEGEESNSSEEYDSEDEQEEWDGRREKYVKKHPHRSYVPPMTIPFQYTTGPMGYAPIAPLPASMASIPMFRALAQRPPATTTTTVATAAMEGGKTEENPGANATPATNTGGDVAPSAELKETLSTMLASPEWRNALLNKLQMNRVISAEQASKLGLRPAAPTSVPPNMIRPMVPMMRQMMPMPMFRAPFVMKNYQPPRPAQPKKKKKKLDIPIEDTPIASRRERRTPRKSVDYSKFFKDDVAEDDDEEEEEEEEDIEGNGGDDGNGSAGEGGSTPRPSRTERAEAKRAASRKTRRVDEDEYYGEEDFDEDEEGGVMSASRTSEDTGVEKILSHRVINGKNEFLVKFHNLSYVHAEWISEEEMEEESMGASRIKRFLSKPLSMRHFSEKHIFNPEYTQIGRIVHGWEHPDELDQSIKTWSYLVKWAGLSYSDATWEKHTTILELPEGEEKLKEFEVRPTLEQRRAKTAPIGWRPERGEKPNTLTESRTYRNGNVLRPYQLEGVNWLVYCWMSRQSCIIADEMGLGKTVQSVAFLNLIYEKYNVRGPFLIVAPLSTIPHWEREFEAWTNLNCVVYHGNIPSRDVMCEYEFYYKDANDKPVPGFCKFDVLITTYEMALAGFEHLQPIVWRAAVFDEAHRLKNRQSKASETLKALQVEHKVLLSGTPLQNNIEELWSLLNFLQPHRFFSESQFISEYGNLQRSEDVIRLQDMLKPLMLRRLKEDVEKSIPVKEETVVEVELTAVQKRYYRAILERNFAFLTKGCRGTNAPNLINAMMELRKCCIHPYLIKGAEDRILGECNAKTAEDSMQCMVQASGKLVLVDKLLRKLREGGHKVLVFSQMTRCLDLLTDYLRWREYPFERIDGAIKGEARQAAIDRFCAPESDSFVFLLCTRAGGVGINLTAADTVVIFDSDWNPQNDIQAQARCHRIGQTKSVKVYRLLTRNTYEREMFDKAGLKLGLDKAVLRKILPDETLEGATHNPQLSKKEVEVLLKKGAYGLLMENDEDAIKFCEEDIDQILARRTTVIRHDGGVTAAEGSIFSKASFAATADDMDIDIDDPNFWELWARRLDLDPRQLLSSSGVVVDEPRIKRQARRLKQEDLSLGDFETHLHSAWKGRTLEESKATEAQLWSDAERAEFLCELFRIGIHRFDEMLPRFPGRSKNDLIACGRAVIKLCLEAVEDDADTRLREDNEKLLLAHLDFDRSAMGHGSEVVDEATGKIDLAAAELIAEEPVEPTAPATREFSKADIPFSGASRRQIVEFRTFLRQAPEEIVKGLQENSKAVLLRLQLLDFIRQLVEGHATVTKKGTKSGEEMQYQLPVPHMVGAAPIKGWGKTEDEAIVIGVYRHGFGRYKELKEDETLIFSTMSWKEGDAEPSTEESAPEWPTDDDLDARLRKVVLAMEKRTQAAAKLAIQAMHANEGGRRRTAAFEDDDDEMYEEEYEPGDKRRQSRGREPKTPAALSTRWSKRDRGEFQRVVMAYGLPPEKSPGHRDWTSFKELGAFANTILRAGDRAFDEYCDLFVKGCKAISDKRSTRRSKKGNETTIEDEENFGDEDKMEADGDDYEADEKDLGGSQLPLIPAERAKKALARITLFDKLRVQLLTVDDLAGHFERSRRTSGLPNWWVTPDHDVALLQAVGKHGFGRWDLVVLDETLPFRHVYEAAHPEAFEGNGDDDVPTEAPSRGRRKRLVVKGTPSGAQVDLTKISWPAETILTRRVETLVEMALNEERRRMSDVGEESVTGTKRRRSTKPRGKKRKGQATESNESPKGSPKTSTTIPKVRKSPMKRAFPAKPSPKKRGKQSSILDFASKKQEDEAAVEESTEMSIE